MKSHKSYRSYRTYASNLFALRMQTAFGFGGTAPTACAFVFAAGDGPGAGLAADAGIASVVQGIVWDFFANDPVPNIFFGPRGQWAYFYHAEFLVPFNDGRIGPGSALIAADAGCPGLEVCGHAMEHANLTIEAASVGLV
jgi:hypothetical protein